MRTDFLPRRDEDLRGWAANMAAHLAADPQRYGVPEPLAQELIQRQEAFAAAMQVAAEPGTRTVVTVSIKNDARRALEVAARQVAALARATPGVSDAERIGLGLRPRKAGLTRTPRPDARPVVRIVSAVGYAIEIELADGPGGRRARPAQVAGAALFTHVGPAAPVDVEQWQYRGTVSRCRATLYFPGDTPPGSRVWCFAYWLNPRGEHGPSALPACTNLPGGAVLPRSIELAA